MPPNLPVIQYPIIQIQYLGAMQNTDMVFIKPGDPVGSGLGSLIQFTGQFHGAVIVLQKQVAVPLVAEQEIEFDIRGQVFLINGIGRIRMILCRPAKNGFIP